MACEDCFPYSFLIAHCQTDVQLPIVSTESGNHRITYTVDNRVFQQTTTIATAGDNIRIDASKLPEGREVCISILSPTTHKRIPYTIDVKLNATPCNEGSITPVSTCYYQFKIKATIGLIDSVVITDINDELINLEDPWT